MFPGRDAPRASEIAEERSCEHISRFVFGAQPRNSRGMGFAEYLRKMRTYISLPAPVFAFLMLSLSTLNARIGETPIQFADRYGAPKDSPSSKIMDKNSPLIEGAIHRTYEYQGWRIRAAFLRLDGPAVRMDFQKMSGSPTGIVIQDYELNAIATANTPPGMSWKQIMYNNPDLPGNMVTKLGQAYFANAVGEKMWQRTDGAILWLRSNVIVRLELSIAREYELQLKVSREQKARASVPQF